VLGLLYEFLRAEQLVGTDVDPTVGVVAEPS